MPHAQGLVDSIEKLCDTTITSIADNDGLVYDEVTGKWLNIPSMSLDVVSITEDYVATSEDRVILCDATDGDITITLPAASDNNEQNLYIKKTDESVNDVIISPNGTEEIDGNETVEIGIPYTSLHIVCDGSNWWII